MAGNFKEIDTKELIELYNNIKRFLEYLDKEYKNTEKMRDSKWKK